MENDNIVQLKEYAVSFCADFAAATLDGSVASFDVLEEVIGKVRTLYQKGILTGEVIRQVVISFGIYWGEVMLADKLSERGFEWKTGSDDLPILMEAQDKTAINPIMKVYKKMIIKEGEPDEEGTLANCYRIYLWMLDRK